MPLRVVVNTFAVRRPEFSVIYFGCLCSAPEFPVEEGYDALEEALVEFASPTSEYVRVGEIEQIECYHYQVQKLVSMLRVPYAGKTTIKKLARKRPENLPAFDPITKHRFHGVTYTMDMEKDAKIQTEACQTRFDGPFVKYDQALRQERGHRGEDNRELQLYQCRNPRVKEIYVQDIPQKFDVGSWVKEARSRERVDVGAKVVFG